MLFMCLTLENYHSNAFDIWNKILVLVSLNLVKQKLGKSCLYAWLKKNFHLKAPDFWKPYFKWLKKLTKKMYISDFSKNSLVSISNCWKNHIHASLTVEKPAIHLSLSLKKTFMSHCTLKISIIHVALTFEKKNILYVSLRLWTSFRSYFSDIGKNPKNSFYVTIYNYTGKYGSFIISLEKKQLISHYISEKT